MRGAARDRGVAEGMVRPDRARKRSADGRIPAGRPCAQGSDVRIFAPFPDQCAGQPRCGPAGGVEVLGGDLREAAEAQVPHALRSHRAGGHELPGDGHERRRGRPHPPEVLRLRQDCEARERRDSAADLGQLPGTDRSTGAAHPQHGHVGAAGAAADPPGVCYFGQSPACENLRLCIRVPERHVRVDPRVASSVLEVQAYTRGRWPKC
mmetsp:Transcript_22802/g.54283  ORF Transcript_22802/g.54283 Transcript_22802/m.54283 type:complete len:208 (+) Transcript_22802:2454-3077(+)